jgi:hypothetical protein
MLDLLILVYVQFVIMLTELQEILGQELKCLCSKTTTVWRKELYQKLWMWVSYSFIVLEINKYYVQKCIYTVYIVHIHSNPQDIHHFK